MEASRGFEENIEKTIRWYLDNLNGLLATLTTIYEIRTNSYC